MENNPFTLTEPLTYLPGFFESAILAAADAQRAADPQLTESLAKVRVLKDLLTWLQGDRNLGWSGELLNQGRIARGAPDTPEASWGQLAHAMRLTRPQSAHSYLSPGRDDRLKKLATDMNARRRPVVTAELPGVGVMEAARRLGVTTGTVYGRVKRGELEHVYVNTALRITADLDPVTDDV